MGTWVFLRGLTRESRHWGDFPETFARIIPDARVVTLDLPGNGMLHRRTSPRDVREMADFCHDALSHQGVPAPYDVLAMSLGAMVALAWARSHPSDIRGCVLINTSLRPFSPVYRRLRPRNYFPLLKLMVAARGAREWEKTILAMTSRRRAADAGLLERWVEWREECPVSRSNAWRQLHAAARFRAPGEKPAAPLLVLASRHDALVHPSCSRALASAWECEIQTHPDAGHDLPLDDGEWVARKVRQWAERRRPGNTALPEEQDVDQ